VYVLWRRKTTRLGRFGWMVQGRYGPRKEIKGKREKIIE
jgi:hypothetical protein